MADNTETHQLPPLELEQHQVREALRCLLHTILFNRALGPVRPVEVEAELLDLSYVRVHDEEVVAAVELSMNELCGQLERSAGRGAEAQVRLAFYEKRQGSSTWFGGQANCFWEQWFINLAVMSHEAMLLRASTMPGTTLAEGGQPPVSSRVTEVLSCITRALSERREHCPPVVSSAAVSYPWEVSVTHPREGRGAFSLGGMKRMLMQTTPPRMLS
mmetsp:Transcript_9620/g.17014  ORF Transcript_9620/g.17014 Transcript_9620/m.17014 type:complete len:216 (+) Transcript_9620:79-726(+)